MDERKAALVDALARKAAALLALAELVQGQATSGSDSGDSAAARPIGDLEVDKDLATCLAELRKWVDTATDSEHLMLHVKAEAHAGR